MIAYKLFKVKKKYPGQLFPLYVMANEPVPIGVWLPAKEGPRNKDGKVASKLGPLAFRPGWHLSDIPLATATYYKKSSASSWTDASKTFSSGTAFTYGGGNISTESSYDVKYTIADAFTTVTILDVVSTATVLMDFKAGGKGIAIGKVAEKDNVLEIANNWELEIHGKTIVNLIYPVGSIYLSVNATSPATLFGGSWTQLKDRFLLGAGSTYTAAATGGSSTHTLSASEMPKHAHDTPFFNNMTNNGEMKSDFIGVYGKGQTASQALKDKLPLVQSRPGRCRKLRGISICIHVAAVHEAGKSDLVSDLPGSKGELFAAIFR